MLALANVNRTTLSCSSSFACATWVSRRAHSAVACVSSSAFFSLSASSVSISFARRARSVEAASDWTAFDRSRCIMPAITLPRWAHLVDSSTTRAVLARSAACRSLSSFSKRDRSFAASTSAASSFATSLSNASHVAFRAASCKALACSRSVI